MNPTEQNAFDTIDDAMTALQRVRPDVQVFVDAPYGQQMQGHAALKDAEGVAVNKLATLAFDAAFLDAQLEVLQDAQVSLANGGNLNAVAGTLRLAESILARLGDA